jgi:hypothetical protein
MSNGKLSPAIIRDMRNRLQQLDKLAAGRRELLAKEYPPIEGKLLMHSTGPTNDDKKRIGRELESIETERATLQISLAELDSQAAANPIDRAKVKELEHVKGESDKAYQAFIAELRRAYSAGKALTDLWQKQDDLTYQTSGIRSNQNTGRKGSLIGYILKSIDQFFTDNAFAEKH